MKTLLERAKPELVEALERELNGEFQALAGSVKNYLENNCWVTDTPVSKAARIHEYVYGITARFNISEFYNLFNEQ